MGDFLRRIPSRFSRVRGHLLLVFSCAAILAACPAIAATNPPGELSIECRGSVKPGRELTLRLRAGERVLAAHAVTGAEVKAGSPLAEIFDGEGWMRLLELKRARQESRLTRAELKSKTERLTRLEEELKAQLGLWKEVEPASAERRVAQLREKRDELLEQVDLLRLRAANPANVSDAEGALPPALEAELAKLETQLTSPVIAAPFDGRVAFVAPDPARASAGETVLEFWDTNCVVRAEVLQHQVPLVAKGCRAEVSLDFSKDKPIGATVESIDLRGEVQAGETYPVFGVVLALDGGGGGLRPGMRVSVRLRPAERKSAPAAP